MNMGWEAYACHANCKYTANMQACRRHHAHNNAASHLPKHISIDAGARAPDCSTQCVMAIMRCALLHEAYQHERVEAVNGSCDLIAEGLLTGEVDHVLVMVSWRHRGWPVLWQMTSNNGRPCRLLLNVTQVWYYCLCRPTKELSAAITQH